ncbi:hypothetical protein GCK32_014102 [Trichostrongylus colubriformis]|uniref:Peptidase M13 C-terminal domain-containing protein n=1 Tax=Trichostrongylus colubriformis TaxID=6319 RepID=A0AAN8FEA0_TRICO
MLAEINLIRKTEDYVKLIPGETVPLGSFLYGSVGFALGHEISHSLDNTGRTFDGNGEPRKWWKKKWTEEYDKRALCYKEQYDNIKLHGSMPILANRLNTLYV